MRIKLMHPVERPRERLFNLGSQALSDKELLAIVLRSGYIGKSALEIAHELLTHYPRGGLARLSIKDLNQFKGLGLSRAASIVAAAELGRRWALEECGAAATFEDPRCVWENLHEVRNQKKEHLVALYLNARYHLIHRETVSIGTLTASMVHPREVFAPAVEHRAAVVILAHNHPSGDLNPSLEDRQTTRRIARAGRILGIGLLDHVLVTERGYLSFRQEGYLK